MAALYLGHDGESFMKRYHNSVYGRCDALGENGLLSSSVYISAKEAVQLLEERAKNVGIITLDCYQTARVSIYQISLLTHDLERALKLTLKEVAYLVGCDDHIWTILL